MAKLTLMVGPPGSGKSTYAKRAIVMTPDGVEAVYVSQDSQGKGHLAVFDFALANGHDVIVDRMGFSKQQRDRYLAPAKEKGYQTEIVVLHEPYAVCLKRCLDRKGHETIKDEDNARSALALFFGKYERVQNNEADKVTRIWPEGDKPKAIVCDLDGTLCNVDHRLHFVRREPGTKKDWKGFFDGLSGDSVNEWCKDILEELSQHVAVVYCSGRPDDRRRGTVEWLRDNGCYEFNSSFTVPEAPDNKDRFHLYMRPRNDSRQDNIVKEIILDFEILTRFTPYFMIDDRKQVVDMWRSRGYTCLHCAEGEF